MFLQCMHVKHARHACKKKKPKVNSPPLSWELKLYPDIILRQKRSRKVREWTDEIIEVQLTKLTDNHDCKRCDFPDRKDLTDTHTHITWLFKDVSLSSVQPPLRRIICENPLPLMSNISYWGGKTVETVFPRGAISGFKQTLHCTWVVHFNYSLRLQLR